MSLAGDGVIGIDLGTRNALCACVAEEDSRPVMIPNRWGRTSTPSVVGWDGGWVVGEDAVRLSLQNPAPVWWDIKRKVGGDFRAFCGGKAHTAQDILVPLLRAIREDAEVFLERFVSSCVLAVPACFSLAQREAMSQAAKAAGLREARIVNEPTAAALAFGGEGRFLILDFGAGTVDVSVVESENKVWQVLESVGSARLGGYDFDIALAEWLSERLRLDPMPIDDPRRRALVLEAENIKIALSSCRSYNWNPPALDGRSFLQPLRVEREDLERMMRFSIRRLIHVVRKLWERYEPERLLLVGGSSRIPLLYEILEGEIARPERLCLCAEESVAAGAALYARTGTERLLLDVLSGGIGFLYDGEARPLAAAGTPLPLSARASFVPKRSERTKLTVFQDAGDMQNIRNVQDTAPRGERDESGRTILSELETDVTAGSEVVLHCALSSSGLLNLSVRHDGTETEMPLFISKESKESRALKSEPMADRGEDRLRKIKLRIASLETLLSESQKVRLYSVIRLLENAETDPSAVDTLEKLAQDLEIALF
jgi:molecular chaperone DnaK (HSP70)